MITRYRGQKTSLITVIRRDGGIYYIVTFGKCQFGFSRTDNIADIFSIVLWLSDAILMIPGVPVSVDSQMNQEMYY